MTFYLKILLVTSIWLLPSTSLLAQQPRPNIIHIIVDDLGWNDVGFHGSQIPTPNIDRLAAQSVILDHFYVAPICSPTRAGVLTGRYPFRFGIWDGVCNPTSKHGLPPSEITIPELLANADYESRSLLGKWHLGLASDMFHPLNHGFTHFYGHYNGAIDYFSRTRAGQLDWHRDSGPAIEKGYSTDLIATEAVRIIQEATAPYYLLVAFNAPHSPLQAKPDDLQSVGYDPHGPQAPNTDSGIAKRENSPEYGQTGKGNTIRQTFAAMVVSLDHNLGKILEAIKSSGHEQNTLLVFHSDNGGDPHHGGNNAPLRGNKFTTWQGGTRVVALIRWPARITGSRTFSQPTCYLDLLPTFAAAAGLDPPSNIDGHNLLAPLEGQQQLPERTLLLGDDTALQGHWKLHTNELFDLKNDPFEQHDVASLHPEIVSKLKQDLLRFAQISGPPSESQIQTPFTWPPLNWQLPPEILTTPHLSEPIPNDQP